MQSILLIEDDNILRGSIAALLKREGFDVLCAASGAAGVALYLKQPADLVITDLSMPEMDGFDVIRTLLSRLPDTKIIATSGGIPTCADPLAEAMRLGAQIALPKPFAMRKLLEAIDLLIGESSRSYA